MKRFLSVLFVFLFLFSVSLAEYSPDVLKDYSLEELEYMRKFVCAEILARSSWNEVTVPPGHYVIGEDIPEGHWTLKYSPGEYCLIEYFQNANSTGGTTPKTEEEDLPWNPHGKLYD